MNNPLSIQSPFAVLLILAAVVPSGALETNQTSDAGLNVIATNAFHVLQNVPDIGLEKSQHMLEQIIETHHRLSQETGLEQRQLSLVLADAIAYAIVTEIHRAEIARMDAEQRMTPKGVPFEKKTAVRLWEANQPDFAVAIRKALQEHDTVTSFVSMHSSEEEVFSGEMIDKAPLESIRPRIRSLQEKALYAPYFSSKPSADELLVYALCKYQAFRDLGIVIDLYDKDDLPDDTTQFKLAIDVILKQQPGKRMDDGMKASSLKVLSTFVRYCCLSVSDAYRTRMALLLGPYMTDRGALPETAQEILKEFENSKK